MERRQQSYMRREATLEQRGKQLQEQLDIARGGGAAAAGGATSGAAAGVLDPTTVIKNLHSQVREG